MSNNAPDYENNLLFEPKSADDLNNQERQSDVLISAIERCEKLEKQLKIAVKALEFYGNKENNCFCGTYWSDWDEQYASVDGDIENGYEARKALAKIEELFDVKD